MRNATILLAVAAMLALAGPAWGAGGPYTFDGGPDGTGTDWNTTANWNPDGMPVFNEDDTTIGSGFTVNVLNTGSTDRAGTEDLTIEGTVTIDAGCTLTGSYPHNLIADGPMTINDGGVITQYGGDVWADHDLVINSGGTYNLVAGKCTVNRVTPFHGDFIQTGGYFTDRYGCDMDGTYKISGGTAFIGGGSDGDLDLQENGTFHVVGDWDGSSIRCDDDWNQAAGATLKCEIDADGIAKIMVDDAAVFTAGSLLVMDSGGVSLTGGDYFDLMTAGTSITGLPTLSGPEASLWTLSIETGSETLRATYVPEPATLALLGIGGIGVLLRRKRR